MRLAMATLYRLTGPKRMPGLQANKETPAGVGWGPYPSPRRNASHRWASRDTSGRTEGWLFQAKARMAQVVKKPT